MKTIPRYFKPSESSYFLFRPGGTGKFTFLQQHYQDAEWINLLDPEMFRVYSARPGFRAKAVPRSHDKSTDYNR